MGAANPSLIDAHTVDDARAQLANSLEPYTITPADRGDRFSLHASITHLGRVAFVRATYGSAVRVEAHAPLASTYCIAQATDGRVRLMEGQDDVRLAGDESVVCDDRRRITSLREPASELTMLRIDSDAMNERTLADPDDAGHRARFSMHAPTTVHDKARWQAVLTMVQGVAATQPPDAGALWHSAMEQFVATAVLSTHPHSYAAREPTSWWTVSARAARRAADFLHEHHADPIHVGELASSLGVTARALQRGFQSVHGVTITSYLRELRVRSAHRELLTDPTATVAEVAYRWGFSSPSRFAAYHREMFGIPPSAVTAHADSDAGRIASRIGRDL